MRKLAMDTLKVGVGVLIGGIAWAIFGGSDGRILHTAAQPGAPILQFLASSEKACAVEYLNEGGMRITGYVLRTGKSEESGVVQAGDLANQVFDRLCPGA